MGTDVGTNTLSFTDKSARYAIDGLHRAAPNLFLQVRKGGAYKSWVFRYKSPLTMKYREMGLGSYPDISLSQARDRALKARVQIKEGKDPIRERDALLVEQQQESVSFKEAAESYVSSKAGQWKSSRTAFNHLSRLRMYAYPKIGSMDVKDITREDVLNILKPVWGAKKATTCSKLQEYIKSVLDYSAFKGWRSSENPATWKGNLDKALPSPAKLKPSKGHYAVPAEDIPQLTSALKRQEGNASLAALFCLLTATRSKEARGAYWKEIDFSKKIWTVPAGRMKTGYEHIVVLSQNVIDLLKSLPKSSSSGLIFPNTKDKVLSDMAVLKAIKRAGSKINHPKATMHGMRASFSTWAANETNHDSDAIEHALSHMVGSSVKRAYQRQTMEEKRRPLMEDWARVCQP